jgi:protein-L-isoaspartate O-methyltransferase
LEQGGRLVVPVSADGGEVLTRVTLGVAGEQSIDEIGPCRFVPLIGEAGYEG